MTTQDKLGYLESDRRSLEMHRTIAEKIRENPTAILAHALRNIERWESAGRNHSEWKKIIKKGAEEVLSVILAETQEGQRLRSSTPFTGILTPDERLRYFKKKGPD